MIDNPRSQRVRRLLALSRRSARLKQKTLLVEGPQALQEAARFFPHAFQDVYFQENLDQFFTPLLSELSQCCQWIHPVSTSVMQLVAPSSQGVFATLRLDQLSNLFLSGFPGETKTQPLAEQFSPFLGEQSASTPPGADQVFSSSSGYTAGFSVVLPRIQDPGNLGTLIRIADAFSARQVIVCKGACDPTSAKVIRASAGSFFHLPLYFGLSLAQVKQAARQAGALLVGADAHQAQDLEDFMCAFPTGIDSPDLAAGDLSGSEIVSANSLPEKSFGDQALAPRPRNAAWGDQSASARTEKPTAGSTNSGLAAQGKISPTPYPTPASPRHLLVAFGNEAQGFSAEELALLDQRVKIALPGKAESLNVAAAAAIMFYRLSSLL